MFGRQSGAPSLEDGARHGAFPASSPSAVPAPAPATELSQLRPDLPDLRDDLHGDAAHGPHWPTPPSLPPSPAADEPQLRWELR